MAENQSLLTNGQLMEVLRELCEERRSGTLFISTDDNHSVSFRVEEGDIVDLAYRTTRGSAALAKIKSINSGRYRFMEHGIKGTERDIGLASTDQILEILTGRERPGGHLKVAGGPAGLKKVLTEAAAEFLGPIATMICEQTLARRGPVDSVDALNWVVAEIAKELQEVSQAKVFTENVLRKLNLN